MVFRRATPAALAVVLLVAGQLAALAHEAATRHITCLEHGEQLEAAVLVDAQHGVDDSRWLAVSGSAGAHDACEIARTLHQSSTAGIAAGSHDVIGIAPAAETPRVAIADRDLDLYRLAPKTSPPQRSQRRVA